MELGLRSMLFRMVTALLALVLLSATWSFGQAKLSSSSTSMPVPLPHLYWHFLVLQNHLDRVAAARARQGEDASGLRNFYQDRLGFSDAQYAPVRLMAQRLEPELRAIDAQVRAVIDADHARHSRVLTSPQQLPPVPPELAPLQQKHEATIQREVNNLKAALGPQETARLETFLTHEFARNVTAQKLSAPHPHNDPSRGTLPPFPQEVK